MTETHDLIAKLSAGVDKLTFEVERLRRDIAGLHNRIEPFEGEVPATMPYHDLPQQKTRNLFEELDRIQQARFAIETSERHIGAMRSKLDEIANNAILRDELKPWIKPNSGRRK